MAERSIYQMDAVRLKLQEQKRIFSPLELYLNKDWQKLNPADTVYVSGSASSGGYRALLQLWSQHMPGGFFKSNGHLQGQIIRMNTALVTDMIHDMSVPQELDNKIFFMPHSIGTNIPGELGTLMGKNEAHLMMHWMMRISGMTVETATKFCDTMEKDHADVIEIVGNPRINKKEKIPGYITLLQTAIETIEPVKKSIKPLSAMILGLDWKNSLGSRLEAALAYYLGIPVYEMRLDDSHPDFQAFMEKYRLEKIRHLIHLPTETRDASSLIIVEEIDQNYLKPKLADILSILRFFPAP